MMLALPSLTDPLFSYFSESSLLLQFFSVTFHRRRGTFTTASRERLKFTTSLATNEHHYRSFVKKRNNELTNVGMKQEAWLPSSLLTQP